MLIFLFLETRPLYLALSAVLVFLGTCMAWFHNHLLHVGDALLAGFGLALTHVSVNTFNDNFDYKSGVDLKTQITPFSGGSGILRAGLLKPKQVLWMGIITLPFVVKAIRGSIQPEDMSGLISATLDNVLVVLITQLLLAVGYILAVVVKNENHMNNSI